jgi:signal transduction histidine kinase
LSDRRRTSAAIIAAGLLLSAGGIAATATSPYVHSAIYVMVVGLSILLPFAVAAELHVRYPGRVLAGLLVAVGCAYFVRSLAAIDSPITYAPARAIGQFGEPLLVWLMLAFPSGTLPRPWSRAIVVAGFLSIVLLWFPVIATSSSIPLSGAFSPCTSSCPANRWLVSSAPSTGEAFATVFRVCAAAIVLATAGILANRLWRASRVMRRVLAPVLVASIVRTVAVAAFVIVGSTATVRGLLVVAYLAVPLAIVVGLVRGRAYDAAALERLVRGLRARPGPEQLREVMAQALEDRTLEIAYWLPEAGAYAGSDGLPVAVGDGGSGRSVTTVMGGDGEPVAALSHDPALLDHPQLLEAVSSTAAIALETNRLETAVAAARAGTITAVDAERRRIERDLHDGTQQRLIALRMKLSVAERILGPDAGRAQSVLDELGGDIDSALREVRTVSHGIAPALLAERGLGDALADAARRAPIPVRVVGAPTRRYPQPIESAVYFCCLEALQNVAKHAGAGASADIALRCDDVALAFAVRDDGAGIDAGALRDGAGLSNIRSRVEELGGSATIERRPEGGTEVRGSIPLAA